MANLSPSTGSVAGGRAKTSPSNPHAMTTTKEGPLACDPPRLFGAEKHDNVSNIFRSAKATQRNSRQ